MKYLPLIWAGLWRKPTRTVLTLLSIIVAFLLFGMLHGVAVGFSGALAKMSDVRLRVISRANMFEPLPFAYRERIERIPGVEAVSQFTVMLGYYQQATNVVPVPGIDVAAMSGLFPEIHASPRALEAMLRTRDGVLIGVTLAERRGWKIGDRVPIHMSVANKDGKDVWTFEVVGIVNGAPGDDRTFANEMWANYRFIDDSRAVGGGLVNQFVVKIADPARAPSIGAAIDAMFANSPYETRTVNEKDYLADQLRQVGDVGLFVNAVLGAVLFTLLFLTGNTMMQSVRDRIPELGVLKAVGFGTRAIVAMVAAEAVVMCLFAAVLGLGLSSVLLPLVFRAMSMPLVGESWQIVGTGLAVAVALGLMIAVLPARRAMRLTIVDALAGR